MANREHLIVADAVFTGQPPGSVAVLHDKQIPAMFSSKVLPHQLGLCDVLMALQLTGEFPRQLTLVGVMPESLALGIGLTPTVTQAMEPALEQILASLRLSGITLNVREQDHV